MRLFTILIILVSIFAIGATVGTIVIGTKTFDGTVTEKPYETGLNWDKDQQDAARLGWSVQITPTALKLGMNKASLTLTDRNGMAMPAATVSLKLTRRETNKYDRTLPLNKMPDGAYAFDLDLPLPGVWQLTSTIQQGAEQMTALATITIVPVTEPHHAH